MMNKFLNKENDITTFLIGAIAVGIWIVAFAGLGKIYIKLMFDPMTNMEDFVFIEFVGYGILFLFEVAVSVGLIWLLSKLLVWFGKFLLNTVITKHGEVR